MKRTFVIVFSYAVCWLGALGQGQGVLSIVTQPVCWTTPLAVDSNITAYYLYSSRIDTPLLKNYLDALGAPVNTTSGGYFQNGYCCCSSTNSVGNRTVASLTDSLLGITTFTVGNIDSVGLDIASLAEGAPKGAGYLVFYDEVNNRNYKIQLSNLINEPYPGYTSCECDTIYQASHGFALGDVVGQVRGNGPFFDASTGDPDSLPVAYVHEVLHTDTFVIKSEGWLMDWTHGLPLGRDYFVQDTPGSVDTIPDSTYNVFAFRTVNTTKAYFDIPEFVVDQTAGSGSTGSGGIDLTVTASNGLNDQDGGTDVDVELGGTLDKATDVINPSFLFRLGKVSGSAINYLYNNGASNQSGIYASDSGTGEESQLQFGSALIQLQSSINSLSNAVLLRLEDEEAQFYSAVSSVVRGQFFIDTSLVRIKYNNNSGNTQSEIEWDNTSLTLSTYDATGAVVQTQIQLNDDNVKIDGIPNYADDAAADADGGLCSGCIYTVTAEDRTIRIKP